MAKLQARYRKADANGRRSLKGYYGVFYDPERRPTRKEVSLGSRDEPAARARLVDLERSYARGDYDPWAERSPLTTRLTIDEAVDRFYASREQTNGEVGVQNYRSVLAPFARSLPPGLLISQLERRHVTRWIDARKVKPASRKTYLDRIGIFTRWCAGEKLVPRGWDPMPRKAGGKQSRAETTPKFFTEDELAQVLTALDARLILRGAQASHVDQLLARIVPFTAGTGLRRGEVCALRWNAIHLGKDGAFVRVANTEDFTTKSGRERTIPLVGTALDAIREQMGYRTDESARAFVFPSAAGAKLSGSYLSKRFRDLVRGCRLRESEHHNFHSLRHTFGTMAVSRGIDVYRVKEIMGHARIETTLQYARLRPVTLASEMQRAFGGGLLEQSSLLAG